MPAKKKRAKSPARATGHSGSGKAVGSTVSGPSHPTASLTELADHAAEQETLVESMPFNSAKKAEYNASAPPEGPHHPLPSPSAGAGTLSEKNDSLKTGPATLEPQALDGSLGGKRVNSSDQMLTTNQGVPVGNNQDSLKAGLRGPTLLEDFILRELNQLADQCTTVNGRFTHRPLCEVAMQQFRYVR
jgi:catalase